MLPKPITSPMLSRAGFEHGFFTRRGGVSQVPFQSLNTSSSTGDSSSLVERNLSLIAQSLHVPRAKLMFATQVHGVRVLSVDRHSYPQRVLSEEADGIMSGDPEVACAVRTADCAPILIADKRSGNVMAIHSGWRGTVQRIVVHAIHILRQRLDREPDLVAAVGPHLEACCFEVGEQVAEQLVACSQAPREQVVLSREGARPHVDLRVVLHAQLRESGVADGQIDHVRGCTFCQRDDFFSYRRDGARTGRLLAGVRAKNLPTIA